MVPRLYLLKLNLFPENSNYHIIIIPVDQLNVLSNMIWNQAKSNLSLKVTHIISVSLSTVKPAPSGRFYEMLGNWSIDHSTSDTLTAKYSLDGLKRQWTNERRISPGRVGDGGAHGKIWLHGL